MLAKRKMSVGELANRVGITPANLAVLRNGRPRRSGGLCSGTAAPMRSAS
ncbi:helix-turn-helix domain-containing protein [Acrocarpospora catenulata]|nr:helix-turn-helix domain-containing protein [Acrocarpospora catenulata]